MKLLTAKEAADVLRVKPQWVYKKARAGLIPSLRLGRQLRIEEASLVAWLAERASPVPDGRASKGRAG
ncbi:MAG: helix-turn-helix domain-containing protein [Chloroflexi bacterium]|nr:helix-turn-helix domain-containing protein [Chloroflexota bacterium]